ncbi:MAG: pyridoxal-dependent decarboxylase [Candidatus Hydrogenedentota bacterium]
MHSAEQNPSRSLYDIERFRNQGHELVDMLAGYLAAVTAGESLPVLDWTKPEEMMQRWPVPGAGERRADLVSLLREVMKSANHLHHPMHMGHQVSPPLLEAALCDLTASVLNNGMAVYEHGAAVTAMELQAVTWMAKVIGFGDQADGLLTSGGSVGNLTALLAAREAAMGRGIASRNAQLAVLGTEHAHYSINRAVRIMGWGDEGFVTVPHDESLRLRPEALEESFHDAQKSGMHVVAVVANACCTPTGTYDPLPAIADFCERRNLWLHVDGAHGAAACLSDKYRHLVSGIERADSVVWDAHKLLLMPALCTAVLFKSRSNTHAAFAEKASYLFDRTAEEERYNLGHRTIECTKRMLGLKLYATLACNGTQVLGGYVTHAFDLARSFAELIEAAPDFELASPPESNIVCFRYTPSGARDLDRLQASTRQRLIESGKTYIVQVRLPKGLFLRTTLMNPLTSEKHLTMLLNLIRESNRGGSYNE